MPYMIGRSNSGLGFSEPELVGWPATVHGLGQAVMPAEVVGEFAFDRADLGPSHHAKIVALARRIVATTIRAVRLVGHTDPVGSPDYNKGLGQRRADAVRRALLATLDRMRPGFARSVAVTTESAGATKPIDRGPSEAERARNRRVEVFLPVPPPHPPPPERELTPSRMTRTETVKVVVRSSILRVGSAVGSVPCRVTIAPVPIGSLPAIPVPSSQALRAFGAILDRIVSDHIRSDARDRMYRLFSQQSFRVVCQQGQIVSVTPSPMDTDVGEECFIPGGHGCITPPALIVTGVTLRRTAPDTFEFGWMGKGRPHKLAEEAGFQRICPRTSKFIWHNVSGTIRCGPAGTLVGVTLAGSRFPTHAVFVNGVLRASIPQGTLGMLWDPQLSDPTMVR
jgi:outer membrane protein OmpA-like peptidoglycan-associated protein